MKKHLSLMLVFLLLLGMTAFATTPATKVYYDNDFSQYGGKGSAITGDYLKDATAKIDTTSRTYFVDSWRNQGKSIVSDKDFNNDSFLKFELNADGNYQPIYNGQFSTSGLNFIAGKTWDATAYTNETYIISVDINPVKFSGAYYYMQMIGNKATTGDPEYVTARLVSQSNKLFAITTSQSTGDDLGFTEGGDIKRLAFGLKYNSETEMLERDAAVDGVLKTTTKESFEVKNLKSVDGIGFMLAAVYKDMSLSNASTQNTPLFSRIRMYTIDNDVPFAVDKTDEVLVKPSAGKIKVKFNRPITSLTKDNIKIYSVEDDAEVFASYDLGKVETVIENGEIYSTAEIAFTSAIEPESSFKLIFTDVADEIGNKITDDADANAVYFETDAYPKFTRTIKLNGSELEYDDGDDSYSITNNNKINSFNISFTNTETYDIGSYVFMFVGVYDGDSLIDYTYAKTMFSKESTQEMKFSTKVAKDGLKIKALVFGELKDLATGLHYCSDSSN